MILNKASVERGLAHASVYKSEVNTKQEAISITLKCIDFHF